EEFARSGSSGATNPHFRGCRAGRCRPQPPPRYDRGHDRPPPELSIPEPCPMVIGPLDLVAAALIGLAAGLIGGLAGIGGSVIMLPGMAWAFGYPEGDHSRHHLYMAAAMVVNVIVAVPAALRHHRERAIQFPVLKRLLPPMLIGVASGV